MRLKFTANNYLTSTQIGQDTSVYTYDIQGNMLTMPHLSAMEWDYGGNLKKSTFGTVNTWYCYDMQGARVRKVTEKQGGIKEERIYLNGYEVYRKHVSGVFDLERQSLNILDVKQVEEGEGEEKQIKFEYDYNKKIALGETKTIENGEEITIPTPLIRYQYDNHLGSACLELDASASIVSYEEYHPFGTTSYRSGRTETEVSLKRYKYVGKERDEETGLYYYGARYYAAWLCRLVSVDALQFKYPELTPFQYASNRPITFIDIDGFEAGLKDSPINVYYYMSLTQGKTGKVMANYITTGHRKAFNIQMDVLGDLLGMTASPYKLYKLVLEGVAVSLNIANSRQNEDFSSLAYEEIPDKTLALIKLLSEEIGKQLKEDGIETYPFFEKSAKNIGVFKSVLSSTLTVYSIYSEYNSSSTPYESLCRLTFVALQEAGIGNINIVNQGVFTFNSNYDNNINEATKVATKTFYAIYQFFKLYDLTNPEAMQLAESQIRSWGGKIVRDALLIP